MSRERRACARGCLAVLVCAALAAGCDSSSERSEAEAEATTRASPDGQAEAPARDVVAIAPRDGTELWFQPTSRDELGEGASIRLKIDRLSARGTKLMVATQTLGASGIPVHAHTFEDELLYVVSGRGSALVGEAREKVPLEPGSLVYVPTGQWHGVANADPEQRMEVLIVTTPVGEGGLDDFFRNAAVRPGHPPLELSEEEFLALFDRYGMKLPEE